MLRRAALGIAAENPQPRAGLSAYRQGEDLQRKARAAGNAIILISEMGFSISDLRHGETGVMLSV